MVSERPREPLGDEHGGHPDSPWLVLANVLGPTIHGRAWEPWLRLTITLAVLAAVLVVLAITLQN